MVSLGDGSLPVVDFKRQILVGSAVSLVGLGRGGLVGQRIEKGRQGKEERRAGGLKIGRRPVGGEEEGRWAERGVSRWANRRRGRWAKRRGRSLGGEVDAVSLVGLERDGLAGQGR